MCFSSPRIHHTKACVCTNNAVFIGSVSTKVFTLIEAFFLISVFKGVAVDYI